MRTGYDAGEVEGVALPGIGEFSTPDGRHTVAGMWREG